MIHNIITDKNGDEHQAVEGDNCDDWSVNESGECYKIKCMAGQREDNTGVIYKRRIKIGDVKRCEK